MSPAKGTSLLIWVRVRGEVTRLDSKTLQEPHRGGTCLPTAMAVITWMCCLTSKASSFPTSPFLNHMKGVGQCGQGVRASWELLLMGR